MRTSVDRANRVALGLVGLLAAAMGVYGLVRGSGATGSRAAEDPLLTQGVRDLVARSEGWLWPVASLVCLALGFIGARWLLAQVRAPAGGELTLAEGRDSTGRTRVRAAGASAALASDIESYPGVRSATAYIVSDDPCPSLEVHASLDRDADPVDVRRKIEEHALPRLAHALERDVTARSIRFRLTSTTRRTVA